MYSTSLKLVEDSREKVKRLLRNDFKHNLETEVAIIGAGISGLYSAYRLVTGNTNYNERYSRLEVQVFEMDNRIGGRLESIEMPGSHVYGEFGGMRYLDNQKLVTGLIEKEFQLGKKPFPMGEENKDRLWYYLRRQHIPATSWKKHQDEEMKTPDGGGELLKTRYDLNQDDLGLSSDQFFNKVIYEVLMACDWFQEKFKDKVKKVSRYDYEFSLTPEEWDEIKLHLVYNFPESPYHNKKVNDIGFWNLLEDQIGQEGYSFLADAGGYYSNAINRNAVEAFASMTAHFTDNVKYKTLSYGFDMLAYKLAEKYLIDPNEAQRTEANIWIENKLLTFRRVELGHHRYQLEFLNIKSGQRWEVKANNIILAMPQRSLQLLDQNNFFFRDEELQHNILSVIPQPSFKLLLGFTRPWWKETLKELTEIDETFSGHSVTDLPLRQCYYFGVNKENQHALLLASYNDMRTVQFWQDLGPDPVFTKPGEYFEPKPTNLVSKNDLEIFKEFHDLRQRQLRNIKSNKTHPTLPTKLMVDVALKQLKELHPHRVDIPEPYIALYKNWTADPFGGGYHGWKPRYNVKDVMTYMRRPHSQEQIFICGEAYSAQQGWVEGALCVAEKLLEENFDLEKPEWLDKSYYLGW